MTFGRENTDLDADLGNQSTSAIAGAQLEGLYQRVKCVVFDLETKTELGYLRTPSTEPIDHGDIVSPTTQGKSIYFRPNIDPSVDPEGPAALVEVLSKLTRLRRGHNLGYHVEVQSLKGDKLSEFVITEGERGYNAEPHHSDDTSS
ncbi:hypothetical protein HOK09_00770 [Candidatus Woesearchaeota archaeon]|jgi:hypothetical protein|nr:hypothetical protein [Candidatus Woesearchaeota archaeon]